MAVLQQRKNGKLEELILTGMIVSDDFYSGIRSVVKTDYFCNPYSQKVAEWCIEFYTENGKVPFDNIFHMFEAQKDDMPREDTAVIGALFERINEVYAEVEDNFNHEYLLNKVAIPYFEKREVELRAEKALGFIAQNDVESAKNVINTPLRMRESIIQVINPFESDRVEDAIFTMEEPFFQYPGQMGKIIGDLSPGWFINLAGAMKRGKSNFLYDTVFLLAMANIKVYHVSMEMDPKTSVLKWAKRIAGASTESGMKIFPCFDCKRNQDGSCEHHMRPVQEMLLGPKGKKPKFDIEHPHIPCTFCRSDPTARSMYEPATWFEVVEKSYVGTNYNLRTIEAFNNLYGKNNVRSVTYPKFGASLDDIIRDLDNYSLDTGWIPKAIVFDYLDATRIHAKKGGQMRDGYDETWKKAAGFLQERAMLGFNVSQPNRGGIAKRSMDEQDTSEDIRKMAHIDLWLALNQLPAEKRDKTARIGVVAHRHHDFDKTRQVLLLQDIDTGQFCLDSEIVYVEEDEE